MKIPLTDGFILIPEGEYVFQIEKVEQDDDFGIIKIHLVTAQGLKMTERFSLKLSDEEYNDKALAAFSYFAKTAMNDYTLEDVDPDDLVGHYIRAEVVHTEAPSKKNKDKMNTYANLGTKSPATGFDTQPSTKVPTTGNETKSAAPIKGLDLDALLG